MKISPKLKIELLDAIDKATEDCGLEFCQSKREGLDFYLWDKEEHSAWMAICSMKLKLRQFIDSK